MIYYDTSRELLMEDINDIEHILSVLEGVTTDVEFSDKQVKLAYGRAIYHVLAYAVRILEKERRKQRTEQEGERWN